MRPFSPNERAPECDADSVMFLLETPKSDLVNEMLILEDRFFGVLQVFHERSELHVEKIQPKLEEADVEEQGQYTEEDIDRALGVRLKLHLQRLTEDGIPYLDSTIADYSQFLVTFREAAQELYPKKKFIQVELL